MLAFMIATGCRHELDGITSVEQQTCEQPARLMVQVTPLRDPEAFAILVDDHYQLSDLATRLQRIPGVTNIQVYETTHFMAANLRPAAIDAVRCQGGVIEVSQARTNTPPPTQ
jgi:hypothetical protein